MAREHIPDAVVGSAPGLEIRRGGAGAASASEGGQSAHSLALTSLSSRRLKGVPVAQKIAAKQWRYLDHDGNAVTRAEAVALAGGVIYYQDATDPSRGQLRRSGRFVSEDQARTVAGSDCDTQDGHLTGIDEDAEYEGAEGGKGGDGSNDEEDGGAQHECIEAKCGKGGDGGNDEEEEEEGAQHECVESKCGEQARPRVGDTVKVMIENEPDLHDPGREGTRGLTGTIVEDDGSHQPFLVTLANGESLWYCQHWVELQQARDGQAEENGEVQVIKTSQDFWRVQIEAVYRKRNPQKLEDVPKLLEQNRGREMELYQRVCRRYDLDPKKLYRTDQRAWDDEENEYHRSAGVTAKSERTCKKIGHVGLPLLLVALALPAAMAVLS